MDNPKVEVGDFITCEQGKTYVVTRTGDLGFHCDREDTGKRHTFYYTSDTSYTLGVPVTRTREFKGDDYVSYWG